MAILDQIIDDAADDDASTASLLRKAWILARRVEATELEKWVKQELNGYARPKQAPLPTYRGPQLASVVGTYSSPGRLERHPMAHIGVPEPWANNMFWVRLHQPIAELEDLAASAVNGSMPSMPWAPQLVQQWNKWEDDGIVPSFQFTNLIGADIRLSPSFIRGVISRVRNTLLELALDLQQTNPSVGEIDGPTMKDSIVAETVWNVTNNVYGNGNNVGQGQSVKQSSTVQSGDAAGLQQAIRAAGITDPEELGHVAQATSLPEAERPAALARFLARVRSGAVALSVGVTTEVAADQIHIAIQQFLGLS